MTLRLSLVNEQEFPGSKRSWNGSHVERGLTWKSDSGSCLAFFQMMPPISHLVSGEYMASSWLFCIFPVPLILEILWEWWLHFFSVGNSWYVSEARNHRISTFQWWDDWKAEGRIIWRALTCLAADADCCLGCGWKTFMWPFHTAAPLPRNMVTRFQRWVSQERVGWKLCQPPKLPRSLSSHSVHQGKKR